jgi:hypothetical protein
MAKRRRLTSLPVEASPDAGPAPQLERKAWLAPTIAPPIALVAGDAAQAAALSDVAGVLAQARAEGLLLRRLPLQAVEADHLVRDRLALDADETAALIASLRAHGQRTPVEVTELAPGRYGLISGWRRLMALRSLHTETGDPAFAHVTALLRQPATAADAYVAMVEENEIRQNLGHYERARIVARAVEAGVFPTDKAALQTLFASASRAKRSKIGSFLTVCRALDSALRFPAALPERLGLALAQALEAAPATAGQLAAALKAADPADAAAEQAVLARALRDALSPAPRENVSRAKHLPQPDAPPATPETATSEPRPGVTMQVTGGFSRPVITLSGPAVDPTFRERLEAWLARGD